MSEMLISQNYNQGWRSATPFEILLVGLTMIALPLFEAPKNVLSIILLAVWLLNSMRAKSFGDTCHLNWPIWGLFIILWLSPFFSGYGGNLNAINSAPRWTLLALFVIVLGKTNFSRTQTTFVWCCLLVGGVAAVLESLWVWQVTGNTYPEFRSVGHVNHSSMYSMVVLACGLGAILAQRRLLQLLGGCALFSSLVFVPPSQSIVGAATAVVLFICFILILSRSLHSGKGLLISILAACVLASVLMASPLASGLRNEIYLQFIGDYPLSGRDRILNSALAVWDQNPLFGTGWFSFGTTTSEERVRSALEAAGRIYDPNVYWHEPHGHNLWTTILIERGLFGILLVTTLLYLYVKNFLPIALTQNKLDTFDRAVAVSAFLIAVGFAFGGLGNTTMMNEHGHAGMAFIGVAYGYLRGRGLLPYKPD